MFWDKINSYGPRKSHKILFEIHNEDGSICGNVENILEHWKSEIEKLYNGPESVFDLQFYNTCMLDKMVYEESMNDPLYLPNAHLNGEIIIYNRT